MSNFELIDGEWMFHHDVCGETMNTLDAAWHNCYNDPDFVPTDFIDAQKVGY